MDGVKVREEGVRELDVQGLPADFLEAAARVDGGLDLAGTFVDPENPGVTGAHIRQAALASIEIEDDDGEALLGLFR